MSDWQPGLETTVNSTANPTADPQVALDDDGVRRWIYTGLGLSRIQPAGKRQLRQTIPWYRAYLNHQTRMPPPGVLADIGYLLLGYPLEFHRGTLDHAGLNKALRTYEDDFLSRLTADRHLTAVRDAMAALDDKVHAEAVVFITHNILSRLSFNAAEINPAIARRLFQKPIGEIELASQTAVQQRDLPVYETLARQYDHLRKAARHCGALLRDFDVLTLENPTLLSGMTQRTIFRQISDAAESLQAQLPRKLRRVRRPGERATRMEDESTYPTGGFSAITNHGAMENLVTSELVYMEDHGDFDMFDVRFSEGDLLYYARDDSVYFRHHSRYVFYFHGSLNNARVKDAEMPWQRIILVFALMLTAIRKLSYWLSEEALSFQLVFENDSLQQEKALCLLFLHPWLESGQVTLAGIDAVDDKSEGVFFYCRQDWDDNWPASGNRNMIRFNTHAASPQIQQDRSAPASAGADSLWRNWLETGRNLLQLML